MTQASFRFYGELNDFVPPARRQVRFAHLFDGRASVKDLFEGLGVPHTEVDLILVNDAPVDFGYLVREADRISVFPVFRSIDVQSVGRLAPTRPDDPRFALDTHLGRLAAYLRLAGFDALYRNDYRDEELAALSSAGGRILLTRDVALLKRREVGLGHFVRETAPRRQLIEVLRRFDLARSVEPFCRCLRCNARLRPAMKDEVAPRLPPRVEREHDEFHVCPGCGGVYWKGSHFGWMERFLTHALDEAAGSAPVARAAGASMLERA